MSNKRQHASEKKNRKFKPSFLKEIWLLLENVNCSDASGRFEVVSLDPKAAAKEGHKVGLQRWIYIQPDGEGTPRWVFVRDLSGSRELMEKTRKYYERDRNKWTHDQEPPRESTKICMTSRESIRKAKSVLRKQQQLEARRAKVNEFLEAKRRRRARQSDGAVPSCSGVPRSRQLITPSPPSPSPAEDSIHEEEDSYSTDVQSVTSSSTDERERRFKRLVESLARTEQFKKRSAKSMNSSYRSSQRRQEHHRRRLKMSTPSSGCSHEGVKLTIDQATQTDPPMEVEESPQEEDQEGEEEMEEEEDNDDEEEDPDILEGRRALLKMGKLINTITTQFNSLTQNMGLEGMEIDLSDLDSDEDDLVEEESETLEEEQNAESLSDQSGENAAEPEEEIEDSVPEAEEEVEDSASEAEEVEDSAAEPEEEEEDSPEPERRVSSPVQANASPSVRRVPTPQQPVVGSVQRAHEERQSSNESGEHFVTTSNIMGPGPSRKRTVRVRRVSAQTTNRIERGPGEDLVPIGNGRAMVPSRLLEEIDWNSYTQATRQLLQAVFPRRVLATHSLTGKRSPAFMHKPPKKQLDPELVEDVVIVVMLRCGVTERLVRNCITIKCTDEAKLYRSRRQCRQGQLQGSDQENVPPSQTTDETTETSSGDS